MINRSVTKGSVIKGSLVKRSVIKRSVTKNTWMRIVAIVALGGIAAACGPTAPDPTTSGPVPRTSPPTAATTTSTSSTTSTTLGSAQKPVTYRWARVTTPSPAGSGGATSTLASVLAPDNGGTWVLAGTRTAANGTTRATVWTSTDATRWTATRLRGGTDGQAHAAAYWGNRTVVVGSVGNGPARRAAVWISRNPGASFTPVPDSPELGTPAGAPSDPSAGSAEPTGDSTITGTASGPGAAMDTVAAGALGLFASGTVGGQLALWYSSDGTSWVRLTKAESVIGSQPGAVVRQILETPAGVFAVGSVRHDGTTDAALWTSGDGMNWRLLSGAANFASNGEETLSSLATFGPNLVLAGGIRLASSWVPASWISPNSFTWGAPSESFPEPTGRRADLAGSVVADLSAAPNGSALAAVGGSPTEQRLWTSTDGINWTPVALPESAANDADWTAGAVATTGSTTVVIDPTPGQPRLLVDAAGSWTEVTADARTFGSPRTVVTPTHLVDDAGRLVMTADVDRPGQRLGEDQVSTEILTSSDGRHWTVAPTGDTFASETVTDLAVTERGLVALGGPAATTALVSAPDGPQRSGPTVWRSRDAVFWTAVALGGPGPSAGSGAPTTTTTTGPTTTGPTTTGTAPPAPAPASPPPANYGPPAGAVTSLGATTYVGSSSAGQAAVGWKSRNGQVWTSLGTLQSEPTAAPQTVAGGCSIADTAVLVGSSATAGGGSNATAWAITQSDASATEVRTSHSVAVPASGKTPPASDGGQLTPGPPEGSAERLLGCADIDGTSLVAWGASAATDGTPEAALWTSTDGVHWKRKSVAAFANGDGTAALTDLARNGDTWLAVGGSSSEPWTEDNLSPLAVWESADAGKTWEQLTTATAPWSATFGVSANLVSYLGIDPVIAGQVDGNLAIWLGTPTP